MNGILISILLKRGIRTDALWTHPVAYRSFLKLIPLFLDTWALMKSQYWPREKIERLQDEQLRALFKYATCVSFWEKLFSDAGIDVNTPTPSKEQLSKIPITSKKQLTQENPEYIVDASLLPKSVSDHTSGSTGKPFHFYQDWHSTLRSFAMTERIFRTTGKRYPIVYMRSRPRHGFTFYRHVWFFLHGYNSVRHRMEDLRDLARKLKGGFILYGYTSWVLELARQIEKLGMELPIRVVMTAGEHLSGADRSYIERVMKAELFTLYASREAGFLGYECEHHNMHICEEWAYIEVVDTKGLPVPTGHEGRIIVTTFNNRVMPFIRYDIGDVGSISNALCPCGRTSRTLTFKGRMTEFIELEDNRVVSLLDISYYLGSFADSVRQYQIIQTSKSMFVIKIVPGPRFDSTKEALEALMVRLLHPRVRIHWEIVENIPEAQSGKAVYFVRDFEYRP